MDDSSGPMGPFSRLLQWGERLTKVDLSYIAAGGFWLTLEQVCFALIALGLSVAFANLVSQTSYGTYRFLLSVFWTLTAFSLTGVPTVLTRAIARGESGAYRQALPLTLLGALPMSVIAGMVSAYYFFQHNILLAQGVLIIVFLAPLFQAGYLYGAVLEGKRDFRRLMLYGVALNAVPALALLALMPVSRSPLAFFSAYLVANVIAAGALSVLVLRAYPMGQNKSSEFGTLSYHLSAVNVLGTIATQADQLLAFHFVGPAALAIYTFATAIPDQIKNAVSNLSNIAFPKYANRSIGEARATLFRRVVILTLAIVVAIAVYIFIAPYVFHLLFPRYSSAIWYSELYALTLFTASSLIPVTVLQAHAATRELYLFNIISGIVQIGSLVAGVILWGLLGLIAARGVTRLFNLLLGYALVSFYARRQQSSVQ